MGRPTSGYFTLGGKRVPSVTTIIGGVKIGGIDPLLAWANKEGLEGRNFRETRDKAATAGSCVHDMVEADIRGWKFDPTSYSTLALAMAKPAFASYFKWKEQTNLKPFQTETSLVSEKYEFGGTFDALLAGNQLTLGDWKSSSGIYPDYLMQLAAYKVLWEEHNPAHPITGGFHLIRFSKQNHPEDPIHFASHYWDQLDLAWEAFLHCKTLYDMEKRLKKMC